MSWLEYKGKLYGKLGPRKYCPLTITTEDVEILRTERDRLREALDSTLTQLQLISNLTDEGEVIGVCMAMADAIDAALKGGAE